MSIEKGRAYFRALGLEHRVMEFDVSSATVEEAAKAQNIQVLTIGVEAKETRNLAIYLHWGYDSFVMSETEDEELILDYRKEL